jgi:hypothetical protein
MSSLLSLRPSFILFAPGTILLRFARLGRFSFAYRSASTVVQLLMIRAREKDLRGRVITAEGEHQYRYCLHSLFTHWAGHRLPNPSEKARPDKGASAGRE